MKSSKNMMLLAAVGSWIAAVCYVVKVLLALCAGQVDESSFMLELFCAVIWSMSAMIWTIRTIKL